MNANRTVTMSTFQEFSDDVYQWAFRVLGRHEDALDVVQDVFLAWDRETRKTALRCQRGWLRTATVNRAIDVRRRRHRAEGSGYEVAVAEFEPVGPAPVSRSLEREDLRNRVTAALGELTDAQRAVLTAKLYDDMTFAGIAAELDVAVSTVKTHYLRALQAMRNRLRPTWATEFVK